MGLMTFLSVSCKEATRLTELKLNRNISLKEKVTLKYHGKMCKVCQEYQRQQEWIDQVLRRVDLVAPNPDKMTKHKEKLIRELSHI